MATWLCGELQKGDTMTVGRRVGRRAPVLHATYPTRSLRGPMGLSQPPFWMEGLWFRESTAGARGYLLAQTTWALPSHRHSAHLCQ